VSLEVRLDAVPETGWMVGAFALEMGGEELEVNGEVATVEAGVDTVEIEIPGLADSMIGDFDDGGTGAIVLLVAYNDADSSGSWSEGDTVVGASADLLIYQDTADNGNKLDTWLLMTVDFSAETDPTVSIPSAGADLTVFSLRESFSFGGSYDGTTPLPAGARMATFGLLEIVTGSPIADRPLDEEVTGDLSFTLVGAPAADRMFETEPGLEMGLEFPTLYLDDSTPAGPDAGDTRLAWACLGGETVGLAWMPAFYDFGMAIMALGTNIRPGWNAIYTSRDWELLTESDAAGLNFSATACTFGEVEE
jgi:hypothetical protein